MSLIELRDVHFSYNGEINAVNGVSLSFEAGEFVSLVGHNGSGKSTIAKLINALLIPDAGTVTVDGKNTRNKKEWFDIRKTAGVVFQNPDNQMVATIIEDDIAFGPENLGLDPTEIRARVDWALESVGMSEFKKGTPGRLSGGQKQRVAIAGILAIKPRAIVLDEATSMLDPVGRREVLAVVKKLNAEEGMTVIMITHFMEEALLADRIVVMDKGKVLAEGGREIFANSAELRNVGLDLPKTAVIAEKLRAKGLKLKDGIVFPSELVGELCQ